MFSLTQCLPMEHKLPVLFQVDQPTHNVAVFRGAALKQAIAKGLVKGFGGAGNGRSGKSLSLENTAKVHAPVHKVVSAKKLVAGNGIARRGKTVNDGGSGGLAIGAVGAVGGAGAVGGVFGVNRGVGNGYAYQGGYDEQPDPFYFHYGVHDDKYYTDFTEERSGDEAGNIKGEYTVALPDGRIQDVVYHADGNYGGTVMEVSYKGEAHHPEVGHH